MNVYNTEINYCIQVRGGMTFDLLARGCVCKKRLNFMMFFCLNISFTTTRNDTIIPVSR